MGVFTGSVNMSEEEIKRLYKLKDPAEAVKEIGR